MDRLDVYNQVIYVDIDNTICETTGTSYVQAKPIRSAIQKINDLYDNDNTIIYWTARGTKTGYNWFRLTLDQLDEWGCKFDELRMGKPAYDLLICDKSVNLDDYELSI